MTLPGRVRQALKPAGQLALWAGPLAFLGLFFFYPLAKIMSYSFGRSENGMAGLSALLETLISTYTLRVLGFSVGQAALSTLLTLVLGLPAAFLFARYRFPGKALLSALAGIPFIMPTLVTAAAFNTLLGQRGWINTALVEAFGLPVPPIQFEGTLAAILLAHVFYNTTVVLRSVGDFWAHLDPRLEQAARSLGASRWQALRQVTLPLLLPAIGAATVLVFLFNFTSFGVILILGGPRFATLEVEIYYQTVSLFNLPLAASLSLIQLAFTLALTIIYNRLSSRVARPLNLRPIAYTQKALLSWRERLFAGLVISILLALLTLPLLSLAARSIIRVERNDGIRTASFTLDYYRELSANRRQSQFYAPPARAIGLSLGYAGATVFLALLLGLPAAWALAHNPEALSSRIFDPLMMLPLGASAVTLGLGFILTLNRPPLDLRSSPLLIPLVHTLAALPFVVRSLTPALRSIRPRLRQAASSLGATPGEVLRWVDLPLVGRPLLVAASFAFTISLGEFGATAIIARPEYPTIPLMIYRYLSQPGELNYGQAVALSTLLMITCAAGMLAIERLRLGEIGEF